MRTSRYLLATLKETPGDAEIISHRLMLRAGLIRRAAAGIYNYLPSGVRVLRHVERIIREEMNRAGAEEVLLPAVQPAELWRESGRWEEYGPELLRFTDRHQRDFCIGPTHEEVITALIKNEVRSYRQLPANYYQIQTKFRDEMRPRFGVMRGREFIMKDAYSFDIDRAGLQRSYEAMHATYTRIFERMELSFTSVDADSGAIGGHTSCEFHVLADSGEDAIATCAHDNYTANAELTPLSASPVAPSVRPASQAMKTMTEISTPNTTTVVALCKTCAITPQQIVKTLLVKGEPQPVALLLRGDHELSVLKAGQIKGVASPLQMADADEVRAASGTAPGYIGPVGLKVPMVADHSALAVADFYCGANRHGHHLGGVNWGRDVEAPQAADLRKAESGDLCPLCLGAGRDGRLHVRRGIEVGHIFQLGDKYSRALNAVCLDKKGGKAWMQMGCYGIGVTRVIAACIEQNHDERGIVWPQPLAPFAVCVVPIGYHKSEAVRTATDTLYSALQKSGLDVLLDDRDDRAGVMFADMELLGIPHRLVLSEKTVPRDVAEYRARQATSDEEWPLAEVVQRISEVVAG